MSRVRPDVCAPCGARCASARGARGARSIFGHAQGQGCVDRGWRETYSLAWRRYVFRSRAQCRACGDGFRAGARSRAEHRRPGYWRTGEPGAPGRHWFAGRSSEDTDRPRCALADAVSAGDSRPRGSDPQRRSLARRSRAAGAHALTDGVAAATALPARRPAALAPPLFTASGRLASGDRASTAASWRAAGWAASSLYR